MFSFLSPFHLDPLFFYDFLNLELSPSLGFFFKVALQKCSINAWIQFVSMECVAHSVRKLVDQLSICQLNLVFDEILHTVVLAKILQLSQLLFRFHDCIAIFELLLELQFPLLFLLYLLHFAEDKNFKVNGFLALFLPVSHLSLHLIKVLFKFCLLLLVNIIN